MLIDFHTHLLPEPLLGAALRECRERLWPPRYEESGEALLERLARTAERFGVMPYAAEAGQARALNRWSAGLARREPRAVPLATFHPADDDLSDLVHEAFDELQLAGADLHCQAGQFYPDDRRLFPLYRHAVNLQRPVVFHVSRAPLPNRYVGVDPFYQLMRRFPRLRAVVAHLGADEMEAFFDLATLFDELYLDTSLAYCQQTGWQPRLERVLEFQDRIVYASGLPFTPCDPASGVEAIRRLRLGPGIESKLFYSNAARLLAGFEGSRVRGFEVDG